MSGNLGNNYEYSYPPPPNNYPLPEQSQQWNNWAGEQPYPPTYQRGPTSYYGNNLSHSPNVNTTAHSPQNVRPPLYPHHSLPPPNHRMYHQRAARYNNRSNEYSNTTQHNRNRHTPYKRNRPETQDVPEPKSKSSRKKKKPLSQNVPSVRSWSIEDASKALVVEKEYNKRYKNHSLIIKFPDLEINKEIVSRFHEAIENVHFQQPSTARYCFVTLQESADADKVISALNMQKFGDGFLAAEYKKDREEDQNIGPEDIDPLTLYVGNLAQEITKDDMVTTFPRSRRIDIGFAKKMKFTRYAFVTFKSVDDSVEAFRRTHSTQLHSKSLIVRFRRLHGTVGMPGESKPQNKKSDNPGSVEDDVVIEPSLVPGEKFLNLKELDALSLPATPTPNLDLKIDEIVLDLNKVKPEPDYLGYEVEKDVKPLFTNTFKSPFMPGCIEEAYAKHKPKIKVEVKKERSTSLYETPPASKSTSSLESTFSVEKFANASFLPNTTTTSNSVTVKTEPRDVEFNNIEYNEHNSDFDSEEDDGVSPNFLNMYQSMVNHMNKMSELKKPGT